MMQHEFEARINQKVTEQEWSVVETIYTFHPAIDNVDGKDQIAKIWKKAADEATRNDILAGMHRRAVKLADLDCRRRGHQSLFLAEANRLAAKMLDLNKQLALAAAEMDSLKLTDNRIMATFEAEETGYTTALLA